MPEGFAPFDEHDAVLARTHLEEHGWSAQVYGVPVTALVDALVSIARENIENGAGCTGLPRDTGDDAIVPVVKNGEAARAFDTESIEMLEHMWSNRQLPRDVLTY